MIVIDIIMVIVKKDDVMKKEEKDDFKEIMVLVKKMENKVQKCIQKNLIHLVPTEQEMA